MAKRRRNHFTHKKQPVPDPSALKRAPATISYTPWVRKSYPRDETIPRLRRIERIAKQKYIDQQSGNLAEALVLLTETGIPFAARARRLFTAIKASKVLIVSLGAWSGVLLMVMFIGWAWWKHGFFEIETSRWIHAHLVVSILSFCAAVGLFLAYFTVGSYRLIDDDEDVGRYGAMIGVLVAFFFIIFCLGFLFRIFVFPKAINDEDILSLQVGLLFFILSLGALAFYFKRISKMYYGLVEIITSSVSTWFLVVKVVHGIKGQTPDMTIRKWIVAGGISPNLQEWIAASLAAYVFSRGIGNLVEGFEDRKKASKSKIAAKVQGRDQQPRARATNAGK